MEFLVNRNYRKVSIGVTSSNEYLSVMVSPTEFENMRYGGIVWTHDVVRLEGGYLTYFRINPAYRERFEDSFSYCSDEATLVAFVEDSVVYIVMEGDNRPLLYPRDYRYFREQAKPVEEKRA